MMPLPRLEIRPDVIEANSHAICDLVAAHGGEVWGVGKVLHAHPAVVDAIGRGGCEGYADSRLEHLERVRGRRPEIKLMLLRAPAPSQAYRTVACCDISLNSSLTTLRLLSEAATRMGTTHQVVIMVDLGDLREGVWPDRLPGVVAEAAKLPHLEVVGIGVNMACYGGVAPTVNAMEWLVALRDEAAAASGLPLRMISGGNSSALDLIASGKMPREVSSFRMGESIILGRNVLTREPWPGTRQDACRIVAEVIEVEHKPSVPPAPPEALGQDAFGGRTQFVDRGVRPRAVVSLGRADVAVEGLTPCDERMIILGASSDHLLVDVGDADAVEVGDEIAFWPNYAALLAAATSPSVAQVVVPG